MRPDEAPRLTEATRFDDIALAVPHILLPGAGVDLSKWAVIACDQHTSQPGYWEEVANHVGDAPSSLQLIYPEVFLEAADRHRRIEAIHEAMRSFVDDGLLVESEPGFVLVDRQTPDGATRRGLMAALDLEQYSWAADATSLIRTTEGTVLERLPPRVEVRAGAPLETPHTLVLIDDPERTVIEPLTTESLPEVYDTELMCGGGRVRGWWVRDRRLIERVVGGLRALAAPGYLERRHGVPCEHPFLYAMGDGNHSFAAARQVWEQIKADAGGLRAVAGHPARHALVELVNVHDEGLIFEPIHRVVFGVDQRVLLAAMADFYHAQGSRVEIDYVEDVQQWRRFCERQDGGGIHHVPFVAGEGDGNRCQGVLNIRRPAQALGVVALQEFLSGFGERHGKLHVDYIHGIAATEDLGARAGNVGLVSQVIDKHALFRTILADGPLPRKSFSLGEAAQKRYYLECRRLTP